ncbi:multicopper oxidase family protein [Massilia sp. SYSU DXS3249]
MKPDSEVEERGSEHEPQVRDRDKMKRRLAGASLVAAGAAVLAAEARLGLGTAPAPAPAAPGASPGTGTQQAGTRASGSTAGGTGLAGGTTSLRGDFKIEEVGRAPYTTPFIVPLPMPKIAEPVSGLSPEPEKYPVEGEAGRLPHQAWDRFPPQKFYHVKVEEKDHEFHPELPKQKIWGYGGITPGLTFVVKYGEPILVRFENELPLDHVGYGTPEISTHLHNGHTPSESDGFPGDYYSERKCGSTLSRPGKFKDHHYPNICSNVDAFPDTGGNHALALGTLWYHDHRMEFTAPNVYRGLAGFYLIFDELDSDDEYDEHEGALGLPSGVGKYDIPLVFQDRRFDSGGYLYFDQFDPEGIVGDKFLVNGKVQPFFSVERRKYRFRMLNGSSLRFYEFYLVYQGIDQKFHQIGNDGNLLPAPVLTSKLRLGVAERGDLIVDFAQYPLGARLYIVNKLEHLDGRGPTGRILNPGTQIMRIDVDREPATPDHSRLPATLRPLPKIDTSKVRTVRRWDFGRLNNMWTVNDLLFDETKPAALIKRGVEEIWELRGKGSWSHPVHIHFEEMRIISRNGLPPPPHEAGRKDVFVLSPGETVRILVCFRDFVGKYVMHCHNTIHEDHHMMVRFDVVP